MSLKLEENEGGIRDWKDIVKLMLYVIYVVYIRINLLLNRNEDMLGIVMGKLRREMWLVCFMLR